MKLCLCPSLHSLRKRAAFTLTEIAIVLGIIGLILGAIWVAAATVYNNQRVTHANTDTLQMVQGIRGLYSTSSTTGYTTAVQDMTSALISAGAVPNDMVTGSTLTGPFPGGATAIMATSDGKGFVIVMSGVSKANCVAALDAVAGTARDPGLFNADAVSSAPPATSDASTTGSALTSAMNPVIALGTTTGTAPSQQGGCTNPINKLRFGFSLK